MSTPDPAYTPPPAYQPAPGAQTNVLAIVAIIAAIVVAPVGIVLGFIARSQIKTSGEGGAGLAKAAIIVGIVLTVLFILLMIFAIVLPFIILGAITGY